METDIQTSIFIWGFSSLLLNTVCQDAMVVLLLVVVVLVFPMSAV